MLTLAEQAKAFAEIQGYLVSASDELFSWYRMPVEHTFGGSADGAGQSVMAVIGYAARGVRGAVLLLASRGVVDALQPDDLRGSDIPADVLLRDVLGEFANMLLGRVKNKLAARSLSPMLATPTTIIGDDLALPAPKSGLSAWHRFACKPGDIYVRLDATFEPEFTLAPEDRTNDPALPEGEMIMFTGEGLAMGVKIMVVDDAIMVRQQVSRALTAAGFEVIEAHDGVDALAKLGDASGIAVVVLDVNMPNMGGIEFLETLRGRGDGASVSVVMLTTEGQPQLMRQAKALGAKGWIVKPFKPDMLVAAVHKLAANTA